MQINDVCVIGMGPAGVTAAIYLKRFGFEPICFEPMMVGGKVNVTYEIQNYPGFMGMGPELAMKLEEQVKFNEIKIVRKSVKKVEKVDSVYKVVAGQEEYYFKAVIIATGLKEKEYKVPGEDKYQARGISRCAVCDGPLYRNKPVAVLGGGNSAVEECAYLATICSKVTLIHRRDEFRADEQLVNNLKKYQNIDIVKPYVIIDSEGDKKIQSLTLQNVIDSSVKKIDSEALFVYVGANPVTDFIDVKDILDERGQIITNENMETKSQGLFAAGDDRQTRLRQVATAVSDGAKAAYSVKEYLKK